MRRQPNQPALRRTAALRPHVLSWSICLLLAPAFAWAQSADAPAAEDSTAGDLDTIVITATAGGKSKLRTSVSTSTLNPDAIERSAPRSTAEIFRNIPGIRSESTGGEGNANIAVRGLPVASGGANIISTGDAYAQDNNQLVMPGYTQLNLFADYRFADQSVVGLNFNNLFDAFGITEAEEGSIVAGAENVIRARSIPGRTASLSVRYEFLACRRRVPGRPLPLRCALPVGSGTARCQSHLPNRIHRNGTVGST